DRDLGRVIITINLTAEESLVLQTTADVISDTPDPDASNSSTSEIHSFEAVADLGAEVVPLTPTVTPGEEASWLVTVTNHGPSAADNVLLLDTLPAGIVDGSVSLDVTIVEDILFGAAEAPGGFCTSGTPGDPSDPARCDLGGLPFGWGAEVVVTGTVTPDFFDAHPTAEDAVPMDNDVEVTSDTWDAAFQDGCDTWPCPPAPDEPNFDSAAVLVDLPIDFLTESFPLGNLDLEGWQLEITPDGTPTGYTAYSACVESVTPIGDVGVVNSLFLVDDDYQQVFFPPGTEVKVFGIKYDRMFVGSNGYITFGSGDDEYIAEPESHFDLPRLSALFSDLDPSSGGTVWWKTLSDRTVVAWEDVPGHSSAETSTVSVEIFFDGRLVVRYDTVAGLASVVGMSDGSGMPEPFFETDFVAGDVPFCSALFVDGFESGDFSGWDVVVH
ncbi:MAG: hypothetical protein R3324_11005, partial [Halobacteriales archaeon]|nr:hypothetical protein [Halobacteriales archaeon]